MSWVIYSDENIKIKGTSNGYFTVFAYDEIHNLSVHFGIDNPDYFIVLSNAFKDAAISMEAMGNQ